VTHVFTPETRCGTSTRFSAVKLLGTGVVELVVVLVVGLVVEFVVGLVVVLVLGADVVLDGVVAVAVALLRRLACPGALALFVVVCDNADAVESTEPVAAPPPPPQPARVIAASTGSKAVRNVFCRVVTAVAP
jgi:hypothetical protein